MKISPGAHTRPGFRFYIREGHNGRMADTVQQIKDRLSIVDVVGQYVKLERSGSALRARCPFHAEKTPSFFVSPDRGTYHCFGCSVGGDIFSFVEAIEGLDFKGALKVLAEKAGVELVYERGNKEARDERERLFELMEAATIFYTGKLTPEAKKYLKERGMEDGTIQQFRIGYAGDKWTELCDYLKGKKFSEKEMLDAGVAVKGEKGSRDKFRNRILFPIADSAGRVVGFSGRIFGENASPDAPKYLNSPETVLYKKSRVLFGLDKAKLAIRKYDCCVLVEGQMDLLASHQAGWTNTVAVSGTAFTDEHAQILKRFSNNMIIALDPDEAGFRAATRSARIALAADFNVKVARPNGNLDPADLIMKEGPEAWKSIIRDSQDVIVFLLKTIKANVRPDRLSQEVEQIVLPFIAEISSPAKREEYIRKVAGTLGLSEKSVEELLFRIPQFKNQTTAPKGLLEKKQINPSKGRQAYAMLLWQRSLPRQAFDIAKFEADLKDAIGEDAYAILEKLPEKEREAMRFSAEDLYGRSKAPGAEAEAILKVLLKERLGRELQEASESLRRAEEDRNEPEIERLMEINRLLTVRIAEVNDVR
jgi:DNA primase